MVRVSVTTETVQQGLNAAWAIFLENAVFFYSDSKL